MSVLGVDWSGGSLRPDWTDGRLLLGADLVADQEDMLTRSRALGQAVGAGVVHGFTVTSGATTLTVTEGLGCNRAGATVRLSTTVTVPLVQVAGDGTAPDSRGFHCCEPGTGPSTTGPGAGRYVLVVRPVTRLDGRIPNAPPPVEGGVSTCGPRWKLDGVQLRAVPLPIGPSVGGVQVTAENGRDVVAHWCLGTPALERLGADPFGAAPSGVDLAHGGLDRMPAGEITDDDLPLAVFAWTGQSVAELDTWSVRRRVTAPTPVTSPWATMVADRRTADGQARFLQFQEHVTAIVGRGKAATTTAAQTFGWLPPAGYLPTQMPDAKDLVNNVRRVVVPEEYDAEPDRPFDLGVRHEDEEVEGLGDRFTDGDRDGNRFDPATFFGPLARYGGVLDREVVELLLQESWRAVPVRTGPDPWEVLLGGLLGDQDRLRDGAGERERLRYRNDDSNKADDDTPRFLYYHVLQNVLDVLAGRVKKDRIRPRGPRVPLRADGLYVVFFAVRWWYPGAEPPFGSGESRLRRR